MSNNNTAVVSDTEDGPFEVDMTHSLIILFMPFVIIPVSIVLFRLIKWAYRSKFKIKSEKEVDPWVIMGFKKKKRSTIKKTSHMETFEIQDSATTSYSYRNKTLYRYYKTYLSPGAVRNYLTMTRFGRIWMVFQVFVTILSIINYVALTYLAHKEERNQRRLVKSMDLGYAGIFLIDFILSLYTAEDALVVYFTWQSFIDLVSIVTPFIVIANVPADYIWFIGMIRIFKATRINRTYKLLSFWQNEDTRELTLFGLNLFNFIFLSASIINATESLVHHGGAPTLLNWHDSLYYIMVTFSTIGFGDLTPTSTVSRVVVMILIILVIIYIPMQTSRIAELFNSMSHFQRASYVWTENHAHVILSGNLSYMAIVDFCREYYLSDPHGHIVIAGTSEPTTEMKRLVNHPLYRNRIFYLRGDVSNPVDSKRFKLNKSTGIFLFNVEVAKNSVESKRFDAQILMQSLKIKTLEPGIPIFIQIKDKSSEEIAKCSGADRVLCYEDISFSLMARSSFVPGIIPLLSNLVNSYIDSPLEINNEIWIREYQSGVSNQIDSFRIPYGLVGIHFSTAAKIIFADYGACLFGIMSPIGFNALSVILNPGKTYVLKETDIALIISESSDVIASMLNHSYSKRQDWSAHLSKYAKVEESNDYTLASSPLKMKIDESSQPEQSHDPLLPSTKTGKDLYVPADLKCHIVLCNCKSLDQIHTFASYIRNRQVGQHQTSNLNAHNMTPIVCILEDIVPYEQPEFEKLIHLKGIYFVSGDSHELSSLSAAHIESCRRVIIFSDKTMTNCIESDSKSVFTVKLLKKYYPEIPFLVELNDGAYTRLFSSNDYEWNTSNQRIQSILNNYEISSLDRSSKYLSVRMECSSDQGILIQIARFILGDPANAKPGPTFQPLLDSETDNPENNEKSPIRTNMIKPHNDKDTSISGQYVANLLEEAELNESGLSAFPAYHFDHNFSAGMVSISSLMHSLLCQSYFRPYIIEVMTKLCSELVQLQIPCTMIGREYGDFFSYSIDQGYIILGLYRNGSKTNAYVFTNPKSFDIISGSDVVFALKEKVDFC